MAGFVDRIKIVFDVDNSPAAQGIRSMKADIAAADGVVAKGKAGLKGLGGAIAAIGPQAAAAGVAIVAGFGKKAVEAFYDTALAAGEMADKTGQSAEEASRLAAVADDFGISAEAVAGTINKMNQAIGAGKFATLGLDIAKAADGTTDVTETFIQTATAIGKIPDATERARMAQQVFGKSWGEISRLMQMDADELRKALENVSDAQVINREELATARRMQAAFDNLADAGHDLMLTIGGDLADDVANLAEAGASLAGAWEKIPDGFRDVVTMSPLGEMVDLANGADELTGIVGYLSDETHALADAEEEAAENLQTAAESMDAATDSAEKLRQAQADLYDEANRSADAMLDYEGAVLGVEESMASYRAELAKATEDGTVSEEELRNLASAHVDLKGEVLDVARKFAESQGAMEGSQEAARLQAEELERLKAKFPELGAFIDAHIARLNAIPRSIVTTLTVQNPTGFDELDVINGLTGGRPTNEFLDVTGNPNFADVTGGRPAASMADHPLAALGAQAFLEAQKAAQDARANQPTEAERKRAEFDRELELLKRKYEVGDLAADEYLAALQRLGRKYRWRRLSDPWMALWREIQKAKADVRDANQYEGSPGTMNGKPGVSFDGFGDDAGGTGPTIKRMGSAPGTAGAPRGGVSVTINAPNALVIDEKAMDRIAVRLEPHIAKAARRRERGQG